MRNRLEDLGRLAVMLDNLRNHELFDDRPCRNKDFIGWLDEKSEENREEYLYKLPYNIDDVQEKIYECLNIAEARDSLNSEE